MRLNDSVFSSEMHRMYITFGEKAFNPERMAMIKGYANSCTDSQFARVVNKIIATHRNAPLPKDILDLIKEIQRSDQVLSDYSIYAACEHCDGDGYVSATKEHAGREYEFAFMCPDEKCKAAASNVAPTYPKWSEFLEKSYKRKTQPSWRCDVKQKVKDPMQLVNMKQLE